MTEFLDQLCAPTNLGMWITSPEVTKFCEEARKERIQNKECACGNDCSNDEHHSLDFFGEYVCKQCR